MDRGCGKEGSSWQAVEDLRKRAISGLKVGVFYPQKGMGKEDFSGRSSRTT